MDGGEVDETTSLAKLGIKVQKLIGSGSYSKVKSATWKKRENEEPTKVALKIVNCDSAPATFKDKFLPRELEILKRLTHGNVIQMYHSFKIRNKIYICLEYAGRGDLLDLLHVKGPLEELETRIIFISICSGLSYLHENNVVHRDLKCENILMTSDNEVKIADFGFAREMGESELSRTFCGSPAYAAPEIVSGTSYDGKGADIWSTGVILFIMVCSIMPFRDYSRSALLHDQANPLRYPARIDEKLSSEIKDLMSRILCHEASKRYSVKNIQAHIWMDPNLQKASRVEIKSEFDDKMVKEEFDGPSCVSGSSAVESSHLVPSEASERSSENPTSSTKHT